MIKYLLLIATIFTNPSIGQVYSSSCTPMGNSVAIYKNDAFRLAIKRVNDINSPWKDSVEIPNVYSDSIASALYAIENMDWSPLKDTIRTLFSYSNFSSNNNQFSQDSLHIIHAGDYNAYRLDSMSLNISSSSNWYAAWQMGNYNNTPNERINSLVKRYSLQIKKYNDSYYYISSPKPINISALAKMFKSINGVTETYFAHYIGGGQYIKTEVDQGDVVLSFYHACGDCPAGCTYGRMWKFKISSSNCTVNFLSSENWGGTIGQILYNQPYTCLNQIMPVAFTTFKALLTNQKVSVTWEVAMESDIERYVIQRSADGVGFTDIGEVKAVGNSLANRSYIWIDGAPLISNNYYRIKSVGLNGETKYSGVAKVNRANSGPLVSVYPNPTKGRLISLRFSKATNDTYFLRLSTLIGQTIFMASLSTVSRDAVKEVKLPSLILRGRYFLHVSNDKESEVQTLVVN